MKKNKKLKEKKFKLFGFTLIELLAVIVVLAIIALIATPIVLNIIRSAKDSANKISVEQYCSAVKNAVVMKNLEMEVPVGTYTTSDSHKFNINNEELEIYYEGNDVNCILEIEENGNIKLTDCKVDNVLVGYECNNGEVVENDSSIENKVYGDGDYVYFDVTTGEKCSNYHVDNSKTGYNGEVKDNTRKTTDNQTSCLKFYAFNDEGETSTTINLILDHNTSGIVTWNSNGTLSSGPSDILTQLESDTGNWTGVDVRNDSYTNEYYGYTVNYSGYRARLITAQEIAQIIGNTNFDESSSTNSFYLDGEQKSGKGSSTYAWLFDYTGELGMSCEDFGCNYGYSDGISRGYYTATAVYGSTEYVWAIYIDGSLTPGYNHAGAFIGIRPVITVLKSKLS